MCRVPAPNAVRRHASRVIGKWRRHLYLRSPPARPLDRENRDGSLPMKNVVVRNIKRADADAIATFEKLGASTVHEALGRYQLMKPYIRPAWAGASIAGPAVTILAQPGDNWMLHVTIEQCKPGDVVVLACTADNTDGMIGDLIATSLKARGVKGVILAAGCRDVAALQEMGFPIWSRAISSKGTVKASHGSE